MDKPLNHWALVHNTTFEFVIPLKKLQMIKYNGLQLSQLPTEYILKNVFQEIVIYKYISNTSMFICLLMF